MRCPFSTEMYVLIKAMRNELFKKEIKTRRGDIRGDDSALMFADVDQSSIIT